MAKAMNEHIKGLSVLLDEAVRNGEFAGYDCLIAGRDDVVAHLIGGFSQIVPSREEMDARPVFDLASVTKPVSTATSAMVAVERGALSLDTKVSDLISEAKEVADARLCDLMSHRGGLTGWIPLYKSSKDRSDLIRMLMEVELERPIGEAEVYSDLGYMLIGLMLERAFERPLNKVAQDLVFEPLGMRETCFLPNEELRRRAVATEVMDDGLPLIGTVHDENARAMSGVSGHAGLFGTAEDLLIFARMFMRGGEFDGRRLLSEEGLNLMTKNQNRRIGGHFGYGWVTKKGDSLFGGLCSNSSFGHTGFTGTSLAVDPEKEVCAILLTNAVHPKRKEKSINPYRRAVFDLAVKMVGRRD